MTDSERAVLDAMQGMRGPLGSTSEHIAAVSGLSLGVTRRALSGLKRSGLVQHERSWAWIGIGFGGHHVYTWRLCDG